MADDGDQLLVRVTGLTRRGPGRTHNEDKLVIGAWVGGATMSLPVQAEVAVPGAFLVAVADGLGGHSGGEIASNLAALHLAAIQDRLSTEARLSGAIVEAHKLIVQRMVAAPHLAGMGTTLAALVVTPDAFLVANVGDSRVYEVNQGFLRLRSTDDGPVRAPGGEPVASNVVTSCLGAADVPVHPHTTTMPLRPRRFLLCSDGLSDVLSTGAMERALEADDVTAVGQLAAAADENGRHDDLTVALVTVEPGGEA